MLVLCTNGQACANSGLQALNVFLSAAAREACWLQATVLRPGAAQRQLQKDFAVSVAPSQLNIRIITLCYWQAGTASKACWQHLDAAILWRDLQ